MMITNMATKTYQKSVINVIKPPKINKSIIQQPALLASLSFSLSDSMSNNVKIKFKL